MAKYTNTLTSHHPESLVSSIYKMSGLGKEFLNSVKGKRKPFKKILARKRRRISNNPNYFDKI